MFLSTTLLSQVSTNDTLNPAAAYRHIAGVSLGPAKRGCYLLWAIVWPQVRPDGAGQQVAVTSQAGHQLSTRHWTLGLHPASSLRRGFTICFILLSSHERTQTRSATERSRGACREPPRTQLHRVPTLPRQGFPSGFMTETDHDRCY